MGIANSQLLDESASVRASVNQPIPDSFFTPIIFDTAVFDTNTLFDMSVKETGTATGTQTANTLQDNTKTLTVNEHQNRCLKIVSGTGAGQVRLISSNTVDQFTILGSWTIIPDGTSVYEVIVSNRLYLRRPGKYLMIPRLNFSASTVGIRGLGIWQGTTFLDSKFDNPVGNVESYVNCPAIIVESDGTDWLEFRGYQSSGGVLNTLATSGSLRVSMQLVFLNNKQ